MPATGKVIGRLVTLIVDSEDEGQEPDLVPLAGKVTFQLNVARTTELNAQPVPQVIVSSPFEAILDSAGYLSTPDAVGGVQYQGIRLPANDDPDLNPTGTEYTVSYSLTVQGKNTQVTVPSHNLFLPAGATIDLATMIPPVGAPPVTVAQAEALLALAVRSVNGVEPDANGNVEVEGAGEGAVLSVNNQTGIVVITRQDLGAASATDLDNVFGIANTADTRAQAAQQSASQAITKADTAQAAADAAQTTANQAKAKADTALQPGDTQLIRGVLNPGQLPTGANGFYIQRVS